MFNLSADVMGAFHLGSSIPDIAEEMDCSIDDVIQILMENGYRVNPKTRSNRKTKGIQKNGIPRKRYRI